MTVGWLTYWYDDIFVCVVISWLHVTLKFDHVNIFNLLIKIYLFLIFIKYFINEFKIKIKFDRHEHRCCLANASTAAAHWAAAGASCQLRQACLNVNRASSHCRHEQSHGSSHHKRLSNLKGEFTLQTIFVVKDMPEYPLNNFRIR